MADTLLTTKFFIPSPPPDTIVARTFLHRRLNDGANRKLTLVSAPAGFGKSTVVSSWLADRQNGTAWLSLEAEDNDPGTFWRYVLAALQTVEPGFGHDAKQIIGSPQVVNPQPALVSMLNEISANAFAFTLVLDDYHVIESPEVHDSLSFFLEHLPPTMHIFLLTRIDPPLPLGRLRAYGDLIEIRAADLQFSFDETVDFLDRVMNLDLDREQITTLERRTEGWVVGLKLAGLSLQRQQDRSAFIDAFSGSHQYILEYLTEEVLQTLSDSQRAFLLRTSILDSFCVPLCEIVTGDSASAKIIDELIADNLFVIPLDQSGEWFRYHHLFTQMLQALLQRDCGDEIPGLHLRAAAWYREAGHLAQAAEHVFRSGDLEQAKKYVVDNWNDMLHLGGVATVLKWVKRLPDEMARDDVYLALANCWARYLSGRTLLMALYVEYAEAAFERLTDQEALSGKQHGFVGAQVYLMRSALLLSQGQFAESVGYAEHAVEIVPPDIGIAAGPAWNLLGAARFGAGDAEGGIEAYQTGMDIAYAAKNYLSAFAAVFWSTIYLIRQGRLMEAYEQCSRAIERANQDGANRVPAFGLLYVALALITLERNQLNEACELVEKGGGFSEGLRYGRTIRARLNLALGEVETAIAMLEDVERIVLAAGEPHAIAEMHLEWARLHIQLGNMDEVRARFQVLNQIDPLQLAHPLLRYSVDWLSAYIDWLDGEHESALETINHAIERAREARSDGELLQLLTLKAIILDSNGKPTSSILEEAFSIGIAQEYRRTWLDAGKAIIPLLRKFRSNDPSIQSYIDAIMSMCEKTCGQDEPPMILTEREMDIMRLIGKGYSNPDIAKELVVTLNTVKKHTSNIYSKLGVASRTQAIAKMQELNLL